MYDLEGTSRYEMGIAYYKTLTALESTVYIIVPIVVACLFRYFGLLYRKAIYLVTSLIIAVYPFALYEFDNWFDPPPTGIRCANPLVFFIIGNYLLFLPMTLLFQFFVNKIILHDTNEPKKTFRKTINK